MYLLFQDKTGTDTERKCSLPHYIWCYGIYYRSGSVHSIYLPLLIRTVSCPFLPAISFIGSARVCPTIFPITIRRTIHPLVGMSWVCSSPTKLRK